MDSYKSINPYTGKLLGEFPLHSNKELEGLLNRALHSSALSLVERLEKIKTLAAGLKEKRRVVAEKMSQEIGKPIREALAEVDKCVWLCNYYLEHSEGILKEEELDLGEARATRSYSPLGIILGIMPWNFPFWQVFRFAIPAFIAGNRILLKHAPNCPISAQAIEDLWREAGIKEGFYQNLRLNNTQTAALIADRRVRGVSLTGSEKAGRAVASAAGKALIPSLLELGGSNAFILHPSAQVEKAAKLASAARLLNAGQSCIAAKRFLVPVALEEDFLRSLKEHFQSYKAGNPLDPNTQIGPLARKDLAEKAKDQIERSTQEGGELILGGAQQACFIEPSIVKVHDRNSPLMQEEVFAPIAAVMSYESWDEAVELSNASDFGLGVSLIGEDQDFLLSQVERFSESAVFINELVKSDPRLPFGGIKKSGYGRELGPEGLRAFTNLKTIYIKNP